MTKDEFYKNIKWGKSVNGTCRTVHVTHPLTNKDYVISAIGNGSTTTTELDDTLYKHYKALGGE